MREGLRCTPDQSEKTDTMSDDPLEAADASSLL
jgi:hypothetical protein